MKLTLRAIPGAPNDDYRAGSDGQIYSRTKYAGFGRKVRTDWYPLKGHWAKKRGKRTYLNVSLCHESNKVTKSVHRLVCMAFHGLPPTPRYQVRHLDGDTSNNKPTNLRWGTPGENWADRRAHGTASVGEKHWAAKLTDEERAHLRWALKKRLCSQRHAGWILGMTQASVYAIAHGK